MREVMDTLYALTAGERSLLDDLKAIGAAVAMFVALIAGLWRWLARPDIERVCRRVIEASTSELQPDSGSTMRDEVAEIRRMVTDLTHRKELP